VPTDAAVGTVAAIPVAAEHILYIQNNIDFSSCCWGSILIRYDTSLALLIPHNFFDEI
jgi:hypothetical protein